MEALFAIVPILGLVIWLSFASLRHERRRLDQLAERVRDLTPEQRFREAYDDLSKES